jgi:hypothetical protein
MIGIYETLDGSQYEVFLHKPDERKAGEIRIKCIKSTVRQGPFDHFYLVDGQLKRNIDANTWKKIA